MFLELPLFLCAGLAAEASSAAHGAHAVAQYYHPRISQRSPFLISPVTKSRKRRTDNSTISSFSSQTTSAATATSSGANDTAPTTIPESTPALNSLAATSGGLITLEVLRCGLNGATKNITKTTGPNGSLDWLNCGVATLSGWDPPSMEVADIIHVPLSTAIQQPGTPFSACASYVSLFDQYGDQYGIPGILLAAFAMQESSCNPATVGGGGEQGLMQLSQDKCTQAPGGNCKDPNYNIKTGASYFASTLKNNGGDLLLSIGEYNGWYQGLTVAKATAAAKTNCCRCQNNLDYLFQFMNGWVQNVNAYDMALGQYHNLDVCSD